MRTPWLPTTPSSRYDHVVSTVRQLPSLTSLPDRAADIALRSMLAHEASYDRVIACLFDDPTVATYKRRLSRLTGS